MIRILQRLICFAIIANGATTLTAAQIAHLSLDGHGLDSSGNNNHAIATHGIQATTDRFGNTSAASHFNGAAHVEFDLNLLPLDRHAFNFWVKFDSLSNGQSIFHQSNGDKHPFFSSFIRLASNNIELYQRDASARTNAISISANDTAQPGFPLNTTDWYMLTATYDGSAGEGRFYINGQLIGTATNAQGNLGFHGGFHTYLGVRINNNGYQERFRGSMDDFRLFDHVLTDSEISNLYLGTASPAIPAPLAILAALPWLGLMIKRCNAVR